MKIRARLAWILMGPAGCDIAYESAGGQLGFSDHELVRDRVAGLHSGDVALDGSRLCPTFTAWYEGTGPDRTTHTAPEGTEGDAWLRDCFAETITGPAALDADGCVALQGVGTVRWDLMPRACDLEGAERLVADMLEVESVGPAGLIAVHDPWVERYAVAALDPGTSAAFPEDWLPDDPVRLVEGGDAVLAYALTDPATGGRVAWSGGRIALENAVGTFDPDRDDVDELAIHEPAAGDRVDVVLELPGARLPAGSVEVVAADQIASLELVVAYWRDPAGARSGPALVRAVVRDPAGAVLLGAPVTFSIEEGALGIDDSLGSDYAMLDDDCVAPEAAPGSRTATVRAELGDRVATARLEWTAPAGDAGGFRAAEDCQGPALDEAAGCACTAGAAGLDPSAWLGLGLLPWLARRRGRRA